MKLTRWITLFTLILTVFSGSSSSALAGSAETQTVNPPELFYPMETVSSSPTTNQIGLLRARNVGINLNALNGSETLTLNLFDDPGLTIKRTNLQTLANGSQVWQGVLADASTAYPECEITFSITDGIADGEIHLGTELYRVRYTSDNIYSIQQIDPAVFPGELEPRIPPKQPSETTSLAPLNPTDDGSVFDVMIVYTPEARAAAGSDAQMQNLINIAISETNQGYTNSGINLRVNLVYSGLIGYMEGATFNWDTALNRLTNKKDGYVDSVHALRDTYHADLVSMVVEDYTYCGLGWLLDNPGDTGFADYAFSLVSIYCLVGNYTLAHEMGHNQGSAHDRANSGGGGGAYPYSYGYQDPGKAFRTIMAYDCKGGCPRVNYWSNPAKTYNGKPMGVNYTDPKAADNWRTLSNNAMLFANFRQNPPPTNPTSINPGCAATNGVWQKTCNDPDFTWSGASGGNPIAGYLVYWGSDPNGTPGTWVTGAGFNPGPVASESTTYLRLITQDSAGRTTQAQTLFTLKYDTSPPGSMIGISIPFQLSKYQVKWGATDSGVGTIQSYNLQYRVGSGGTWTNWFMDTTQTSASFGDGTPVTLVPGQTYYFRVQATDALGNQEAYPAGDGNTWFFYSDQYQFQYSPLMRKQ